MQAVPRHGHRGRCRQRRAGDLDPYRQWLGSWSNAAEIDRGWGESQGGPPERRGSGGGDAVVAGGHAAQRGAGLGGLVEVGAGRCRGQFGDQAHLVAAGLADLGDVRLAAGSEDPVTYGRVAFPQVLEDLVDADVAVAVPVGGAAPDAVGEQAGERGRLGPGRRGDDHAAAGLGGARGGKVRPGVDRAAGASVEDDHDLTGETAVHQRVEPRHVDRGVGGPLHDGVGGGQVEAAAGAGEQDAAEVDQQAVVTAPAVAQGLQPLVDVPGLRVLEEFHLEPAQAGIAHDGGEGSHVRRRNRVSAQHRIVVVFDRHHNCQSSPAHRITLGPWCDVRGRAGTPGRLRTVPRR
ncbi:hypothetical protein [Actinoplanes cyaneus]|uniref:hypothetical protein n=1 Tax=Actinoplanes cyaneus TaxID=52696 RepID=UPI0019436969|nr:hypothetical protein [Actinoplanes cyaneus]